MKETRDTTGLPEWANYIAKDRDGKGHAFDRVTVPYDKVNGIWETEGRYAGISRDIPGDWRDSLTRIIREEPAS